MRLSFEHSAEGLRVLIGRRRRWHVLADVVALAALMLFFRSVLTADGVGTRVLMGLAICSIALDLLRAVAAMESIELTPTHLSYCCEVFGVPIRIRRRYPVDELSAPHFDEQRNSEGGGRTGIAFFRGGGTVLVGYDLTKEEVEQVIAEMETRFPELKSHWYGGASGSGSKLTLLNLS